MIYCYPKSTNTMSPIHLKNGSNHTLVIEHNAAALMAHCLMHWCWPEEFRKGQFWAQYYSRCTSTTFQLESLTQMSTYMQMTLNLVPRSHSVTGNVRSGKVRQYIIFHWPLKKGCGNGLFRGALNEGLVFASSCAVLNKYQLCGGKFCFFRRRKSFTVEEILFKNLRRLCKWYRRKPHVPCHSNKVLRSLLRGTQKLKYVIYSKQYFSFLKRDSPIK